MLMVMATEVVLQAQQQRVLFIASSKCTEILLCSKGQSSNRYPHLSDLVLIVTIIRTCRV